VTFLSVASGVFFLGVVSLVIAVVVGVLSPAAGSIVLPGLLIGAALIGWGAAALFIQRRVGQTTRALRQQIETLEGINQGLQEGVLELYSLFDLSQILNSTLTIEELFTTTLKRITEVAQVESYALFIPDEAFGHLVGRAAAGEAAGLKDMILEAGQGLAGWVIEQRTLKRASPEERWPDFPPQVASGLGLPLSSRGHTLGALLVFSSRREAFSDRAVAFLSAVANQFAVALENARLYERTRELSYRDAVTGLFNRRFFQDTLAAEVGRSNRYNLPIALLMVDIDYFKAYNDTHGHLQGDAVLKGAATILLQNTRQADIVARYGGEELAIILPMTTKDAAVSVAEKLRREMENYPFSGAETQPAGRLTISVGVSGLPEDGDSPDLLVGAADVALYRAKQKGRNRVEVA